MRPTAAATRDTLIQVVSIALASAAILTCAQRPATGIYEYDGLFHMRYAQLLRHDLAAGHGFSHEFPWWQETFLRDHWADKDLLYHLLLIPFTFGDLDAGGKTASIVFGTVMFVCLFVALRCLGTPGAWLWTLGLLLSSATLLYRAGLVRSHVVAIALAMLGTAAILRGSRAGILIASAAYALTHIGWHLLPGIALIHDLVGWFTRRRFRPTSAAFSLAGTAAAVVLNPYFPDNLRLWYVQNIDVLKMAWSPAAPDLSLGTEFLHGTPSHLVDHNLGPLLFTLGGAAMLTAPRESPALVRRGADRTAPVTLGLVTLGLFLLSLLSRRFIEFWAPFSVMFAACAAVRLAGTEVERWLRLPGARLRAGAVLVIVLAGLGWHDVSLTRSIIGRDPGRVFEPCAAWIRDHVPAGETVFTTDWDEFPELFFVAPRQRYLVGLDPTFMYVTSPARWKSWRDIVEGRWRDADMSIARTFGCRYIFADAGFEQFIERADQNPWLRCETRTPDCGVYMRRDDTTAPVAPAVGTWRLEGGRTLEAGRHDFIDVESLRDPSSSPGGEGDCARLHGALVAPAAARIDLAISTDDRLTVEMNGRTLFDSRSAASLSLDDVIEKRITGSFRGYERSFSVEVAPGYNDLAVADCRSGSAWGFFLRISDKP